MTSEETSSKPLSRSSGEPTADRRADYAEMLFAFRDHAAAAEVMLGALELAPDWTLGWFRLGEMREAAGAVAEATTAWRVALTLDPADRTGAALKLQLAGAMPRTAAPPSAFVAALFDQYADTFEHALVATLGYRVPELLARSIAGLGTARFERAVDLGCGTGLLGERLRDAAGWLEGHDISAAMLAKARAKNIYDRLLRSDLQKLVLPPKSADLVAAADVFLYVGVLDHVFAMVAEALTEGGAFAFSVETTPDGGEILLQPSRRYAHSESYVRRLLADSGLAVRSLDRQILRQDRGAPVEGLIVTACAT